MLTKCTGLRKEKAVPTILTVDFTFFLTWRMPFASVTSKTDDELNFPFVVYIITPFIDFDFQVVKFNFGSKAPTLSEVSTCVEVGSRPSKKTCTSDTDTSQTHTSSIDKLHAPIELQSEKTESAAVLLDQSTRKKVCVSF